MEDTMSVNTKEMMGGNSEMAYDEVTVISESTNIAGDITSGGSIDIRGVLTGEVKCDGKLTVAGTLKGDSESAEFFADGAKLEGEITCSGIVKIGVGSIIIGNISATSAVIAGAVKGDIDVKGPVIVDASAVIAGNIKSSSVQINNGAIVEGFCSQCYAEVDIESVFDEGKGI
ncbi:MAG: polymer-forming cytoskeletal protein [Lachnospiraceae bacterium]|nr:polymer-forming cytoskeletal protein [Lachnospiraceae bacterium]